MCLIVTANRNLAWREKVMDEEQFLMQVMMHIDEAEVMTVFFPLLRRALVVDTRSNYEFGPLVEVMPQVNSMEERVMTIERRRPQMGRIRGILGIPWMKSVNTLVEVGVIERIEQRLVSAGMSNSAAALACANAIRDLRTAEYREMVALIRGEGYDTIWERPAD